MQLGIQLYTVRQLTDDVSFVDTLEKLSGMGFQGVEFAWKYGGMEPQALAGVLDRLGLKCCGLHVALSELLDPKHKVYDYASACRARYITTSLCGQTGEFVTLCLQLDEAGRMAASHGLQLTYHNHHHEFEQIVAGMPAQDYLTAHTDPRLVALEIDIGWVKKGGRDPMEYWRQHGTRTPQIHLRDYHVGEGQVTDIGAGFVRIDAVARQAEAFNLDWLIFEQDRFPVSPLDSCRVCIDQARSAGIIL